MVAKWDNVDLLMGETIFRQKGRAVAVKRPGYAWQDSTRFYNRSNRNLKDLGYFYPQAKLDPAAMKGLKVLDLAMGGGNFVRDLRAAGVDAYGLDIALSSFQREDIFRSFAAPGPEGFVLSAANGSGFFVQADMAQSGLAGAQFDRLYSTYGPLEYDLAQRENLNFVDAILSEARRLLKVGGLLLVAPLVKNSSDRYLREAVARCPGLEVVEILRVAPEDPRQPGLYAEIRRVF